MFGALYLRDSKLKIFETELSSGYGCLALLDASKYCGFVDENWELEQLKKHICSENSKGHNVPWGCTSCNWNIEVHLGEPSIKGHRTHKSYIITEGTLLLTTYDSITMAAQYSDTLLPEAHEQDQVFQVEQGKYEVIVVQNFPTELIDSEELWDYGGTHYFIFIQKTLTYELTKGSLPWFAT